MFAFDRAKARACGTGSTKSVLVLCLAALLAACSSSKQPEGPQVFAWLQPEPPADAPIHSAAVEIEDDGLPAQTPPSASIRQMPDDPTAPWSPNYGRSAADPIAPVPRASDRDSWKPAVDDDGLPVPQPPDQTAYEPAVKQRAFTGAYLTLPFGACSGWKCGQ